MSANTVFETNIPSLNLFNRGKVRDIYDLGDKLLLVASDRVSAFDVVNPVPIPYKGRVLTSLSFFWFDFLKDHVDTHVINQPLSEAIENYEECRDQLEGRSMLAIKADPAPVECVVRGYLAGSGWKEYKQSGTVCGIRLPDGLVESDKLPEPIFTPATKATDGHDENIPFETMVDIVGSEYAEELREKSIGIYARASDYARTKGIILADTKFEFGKHDGRTVLIDEVLTPDSSRFWPEDVYEPGKSQPSFDKQFVRDYLETLDWDKTPPAPALPDDIVRKTSAMYQDAVKRITGKELEV
ncbi:MAG: phosphoribosylaminoimidazolesuccinocarboxamide synthase [Planctomycetota bacterium]|jgi:phosphoribosylaminoimidazole-succinocarboxamide synthase|nr:phosphoribosylaminoimidazolesuccinocarboxamide synthase [Planctomycetota bacterium]MDP6503184.1 phosphoribosylaminoimidazolesuccinocarboxamide synthase [Planctomycetota bacterium]